MKDKKHSKFKLFTFIVIIAFFINIVNKWFSWIASAGDHLSTRGKIYEWRFGSVFYSRMGQGTPVVLLHDLSSTGSGYEWRKLAAILSKNHSVYVLDLPGCGRSSKPAMKYSNFLYVQLVNDFCKDIVTKRQPGVKIDLITSGYSASFALASTVFEPEIFGKLLMINPINPDELTKETTPSEMITAKILLLPGIGTLLFNLLNCRPMVKKLFKDSYYSDPKRVENKDVEAFAEAAHIGGTGTKLLEASFLRRFLNADMERVIGLTKAELFLIFGDAEPDAFNTIDAFTNAGAEFKRSMVNDTLHYPHMERPEAAAYICEKYLKGE